MPSHSPTSQEARSEQVVHDIVCPPILPRLKILNKRLLSAHLLLKVQAAAGQEGRDRQTDRPRSPWSQSCRGTGRGAGRSGLCWPQVAHVHNVSAIFHNIEWTECSVADTPNEEHLANRPLCVHRCCWTRTLSWVAVPLCPPAEAVLVSRLRILRPGSTTDGWGSVQPLAGAAAAVSAHRE